MKVVAHKPGLWYLLEDEGALFLDGNYNHGFVGYDWMIRLTPEEAARYRERGRDFIAWLHADIQRSAPLIEAGEPTYKGRRLPKTFSERALAAVEKWRETS